MKKIYGKPNFIKWDFSLTSGYAEYTYEFYDFYLAFMFDTINDEYGSIINGINIYRK